MSLPIKTTFTDITVLTGSALLIVLLLLIFPVCVPAQEKEIFTVTADALQDEKTAELAKAGWKYQSGDNAAWSNPQIDDSLWYKIEDSYINPQNIPNSRWNGRGWFRLHLKIDEKLSEQTFALIGTQRGATEIYLDGRMIAEFGKITDTEISEYNSNKLPILIRFDGTGEHVLAIRYASDTFADMTTGKTRWLTNGGLYPGFSYSLSKADDVAEVISTYSFESSMRIGFFFVGVLFALALLHFLLYIFYRVERANLFYSIYAASLGFFLLFNNIIIFGHQPTFVSVVLRIIATIMLATAFTSLIAFLHVAFGRRIGKLFWILALLWVISSIISIFYLNNAGKYQIFTNITIGLTFTFCILILVNALREKRSGAWILMVGVQMLMIGMTISLLFGLGIVNITFVLSIISQLSIILSVPVAVSVFLARNFARTNRDLKVQLVQIEELSLQKIEQEKQSADLRAENERRAKELEEARQLQLSMLPKKLPNISGLEIAAYMKPATEVGGDYYDFHVGKDGTLTVAVGDATGHGLKAGTVVTATKSLFNNLASAPDIPDTLGQISRSLKAMNLRGLFMAMTMLKIKDKRFSISAAGMPSTIIYRHATGATEEINLRALPLGGIAKTQYSRQEFELAPNDLIVLMSDGFPEMFNPENEMLGFEKAAATLPEIAHLSSQEIINHLVQISETWANGRPQDDDVTFVVLKFKPEAADLK